MAHCFGKTPDDVIRAIYRKEGWTFREGERRVLRCKEAGWAFDVDHQRNTYFADKVNP